MVGNTVVRRIGAGFGGGECILGGGIQGVCGGGLKGRYIRRFGDRLLWLLRGVVFGVKRYLSGLVGHPLLRPETSNLHPKSNPCLVKVTNQVYFHILVPPLTQRLLKTVIPPSSKSLSLAPKYLFCVLEPNFLLHVHTIPPRMLVPSIPYLLNLSQSRLLISPDYRTLASHRDRAGSTLRARRMSS
jgi:hypothetical protein